MTTDLLNRVIAFVEHNMARTEPGHICGPDACCDQACAEASYDARMLELLKKERDFRIRADIPTRLIDVLNLAAANELIECKPPRGFTYTIHNGDLKDIFKSFEMHNLNEPGWKAKVVNHGS